MCLTFNSRISFDWEPAFDKPGFDLQIPVRVVQNSKKFLNPAYLKNKPSNWINGFSIIELMPGGTFNVYPVVVTKGKFSSGV